MMRSIWCASSARSHTGRMPTVVPPFGSVAISGTGRNGAVAGFSQRASPVGGAVIGGGGSGVSGGTGAAGCGTVVGGSCAMALPEVPRSTTRTLSA